MLRRLAVPLLAALILLLAILSVANAKTITPINPIPFKPGNCPFTVSPIVEEQGSEITLTFGFGSTPPAVTDWGDSSFACNGNECDIYVQVVGPQPPNCLVLWMAHKNTHTYTLPQVNGPITNICIFVNGNQAMCADPQNWPDYSSDTDTVGGTVLSVNALHLLAPWILLSSIVAVPAIALYFAKRR